MPWDTAGGPDQWHIYTETCGHSDNWAGARSVWLLFWILVWVECDTWGSWHMSRLSRVSDCQWFSCPVSSWQMTDATLLHTQTEITHIANPDLSIFKPKCQNRLSDVKIFQATFWVENIQVRGNEQARDSVPWIMFSDCNNQKTASSTIASDWGDNEWKHCAFGSLFLWQLDL